MFEAWIIVCVMSQASVCFPAQDTRGPYPTLEQCQERTFEMSADVIRRMPDHVPVGARCVKLGTAT
jgi:hypothetical protein